MGSIVLVTGEGVLREREGGGGAGAGGRRGITFRKLPLRRPGGVGNSDS